MCAHVFFPQLINDFSQVAAKCSNCAELAIECKFTEAGIPCPSCAAYGIPDCMFSDPDFLVANLAHYRDTYLHDEHAVLCAAVRDSFLAPSQFGTSSSARFPHLADRS